MDSTVVLPGVLVALLLLEESFGQESGAAHAGRSNATCRFQGSGQPAQGRLLADRGRKLLWYHYDLSHCVVALQGSHWVVVVGSV